MYTHNWNYEDYVRAIIARRRIMLLSTHKIQTHPASQLSVTGYPSCLWGFVAIASLCREQYRFAAFLRLVLHSPQAFLEINDIFKITGDVGCDSLSVLDVLPRLNSLRNFSSKMTLTNILELLYIHEYIYYFA